MFSNSDCNFDCLSDLPNVDIHRPNGRLIGALAGADQIAREELEDNNEDESQMNLNS